MLNQATVLKIAKTIDDENEEKFNILRRRLSETTRQCNAVTRQNRNLQQDLKEIKLQIKKIKKLATSGIDYTQDIVEICNEILGE